MLFVACLYRARQKEQLKTWLDGMKNVKDLFERDLYIGKSLMIKSQSSGN